MTALATLRAVATPDTRPRPARDADIFAGLVVIGGAVLASGLLSARASPSPANPSVRRYYRRLDKPGWTPPDWAFGIWGPLYAGLTVSGLRVWNAPKGSDRDRALTHFFAAQGLDALWVWLGFRRRDPAGMTIDAAVTLANGLAYVAAARKVDGPASWLAMPYVAWIGFAGALSAAIWRRNPG